MELGFCVTKINKRALGVKALKVCTNSYLPQVISQCPFLLIPSPHPTSSRSNLREREIRERGREEEGFFFSSWCFRNVPTNQRKGFVQQAFSFN